nr:immunoglobulin heavy chain junction region [Mus musculus]
CAREDFDVW